MHERFQSFVGGITACYRHVQRIKSLEMTELGLKGTHAMCVFYLNHSEDGLTSADLCRLCAEDKAAISRTVAALQSKGFAVSDERRYRSKLRLTPAGKEAAAHIDGVISQWVGAGGDGLTDDEREVFYRALAKISANLESHVNKFEKTNAPQCGETERKRNGR